MESEVGAIHLYMEAPDPDSGPHACEVSALLTETAPKKKHGLR